MRLATAHNLILRCHGNASAVGQKLITYSMFVYFRFGDGGEEEDLMDAYATPQDKEKMVTFYLTHLTKCLAYCGCKGQTKLMYCSDFENGTE